MYDKTIRTDNTKLFVDFKKNIKLNRYFTYTNDNAGNNIE